MKTPSSIDRFRGEFDFLSNFYPCVIEWQGDTYLSVEHAYQAAKTTDPEVRAEIRDIPSPKLAKRYGRGMTSLRPYWNLMKVEVMEDLLRLKFANPKLKARLALTQPRVLVEGNWWGDTFWGVCDGVGQNWLGRLLMEIRDKG